MRILVHDFAGHPFQADLARTLGARGHEVLHVHCDSCVTGKGGLADRAGHARYISISLGHAFNRYRTSRRLIDELRYARRFVSAAREFRPDVVITSNDPIIAKAAFGIWASVRRVPWVFWLQDVFSIAMTGEVISRRFRSGAAMSRILQAVERRLLRSADAVVAITDDFDPILDLWAIPHRHRTVIENWAPLHELPLRPRANAWRSDQFLDEEDFVYLYAGTLGLKHDPDILAELAAADPSSIVIVVSEGVGADHLRAAADERCLSNLHVLPFQPWERLPDVLGAADVLVVLLTADAGAFSVPSKVLTCLCAGRPILASIPAANLGSRTIQRAEAGLVVQPGELENFLDAAKQLRIDASARQSMGANGRAYAERSFDVECITDRFERIIESARRREPEAKKS